MCKMYDIMQSIYPSDPLRDELKEAGWNILHDNPGTECGDWMCRLIEQYPAEVVDALGGNPFEVEGLLADMWDCNDYEDPDTGICCTFAEWAEYFATEKSVELFDELAEAKRELSRFKAQKS